MAIKKLKEALISTRVLSMTSVGYSIANYPMTAKGNCCTVSDSKESLGVMRVINCNAENLQELHRRNITEIKAIVLEGDRGKAILFCDPQYTNWYRTQKQIRCRICLGIEMIEYLENNELLDADTVRNYGI